MKRHSIRLRTFVAMAIGRRIQMVRRQESLTQRDFAARLGVTNSAVTQWERGDGIALAHLLAIARIFEADITWLITGDRVIRVPTGSKIDLYQIKPG